MEEQITTLAVREYFKAPTDENLTKVGHAIQEDMGNCLHKVKVINAFKAALKKMSDSGDKLTSEISIITLFQPIKYRTIGIEEYHARRWQEEQKRLAAEGNIEPKGRETGLW